MSRGAADARRVIEQRIRALLLLGSDERAEYSGGSQRVKSANGVLAMMVLQAVNSGGSGTVCFV